MQLSTNPLFNSLAFIQFIVLRDTGSDSDPLHFWKSTQFSLPTLSELARRYLVIQATSVAAERVFFKKSEWDKFKVAKLADLLNL